MKSCEARPEAGAKTIKLVKKRKDIIKNKKNYQLLNRS
jgi:hypothetical protein